MNRYAGYAHPIRRGWWAMLRFAKDSHPKPVLGERGAPIVFETELEALRAVNMHLTKFLNGPEYRRDGARIEPSRCKAEALFKRGKRIEVERRRTEA